MHTDWHVTKIDPPVLVKEEQYNQSFNNFDGTSPIVFDFDHTVQVTTSEDYTQTEGFDISVNVDIPVSLIVMDLMISWR